MLGWVKRKIEQAAVDAMKDDITRFISGIRGASDEEIANMVVIANLLRVNLTKIGAIPPAAIDFSIARDDKTQNECDLCAVTLGRTIKQFQKVNQPSDAFGTQVWLHSVRALNNPELRELGRELWAELSRGFLLANLALLDFEELLGDRVPPDFDDEITFIPKGLEPRLT